MRILITENQRQLILLNEDFKTQKQKYIKQGIDPDQVDQFLNYFRTIRTRNYKELYNPDVVPEVPVNRRNDIDAYERFEYLYQIVRYVRSQVDTGDYEKRLTSSGTLVIDDDVVEIKQAFSDQMCIKYLEPFNYSWCISKKSDNAYYSYRNRPTRPTFYFVKIKDRTNRELALHLNYGITSRTVRDRWHFFVIQVLNTGRFHVTSATNNPTEEQMSWSDILEIDPRLEPYKSYFVSVPEHELDISPVSLGDQEFCIAPYREKKDIIDTNQKLNDFKFNCLPLDLKKHYINLNHQLSTGQVNNITNDKDLINRYVVLLNRNIQNKTIQPFDIWASSLKLLDENNLQIFKEAFIDKGRGLSEAYMKAAPYSILDYYVQSGKQIDRYGISVLLESPWRDLLNKYRISINKTLQERLIPYFANNARSSNPIQNITLGFLDEKSTAMLGEAIKQRKQQTLEDDFFNNLPKEVKKIYIQNHPTLGETKYNLIKNDHELVLEFSKATNEKFAPLFEVSKNLYYIVVQPYQIDVLTNENFTKLINVISKENNLRALKSFRDSLNKHRRFTFGSSRFMLLNRVILNQIKKISSPADIAPYTEHREDLKDIERNTRVLSEEGMRSKLKNIALSLNLRQSLVPKFKTAFPILGIYYDSKQKRFRDDPATIVFNIINGIKKDKFPIEFVKYYIDKFTKNDIKNVIEMLNEKHLKDPYYRTNQDELRLQNWFIQNKKKQMGLHETELKLMSIIETL